MDHGCFHFYMFKDTIIATLGSILDSQLSWESCKFQLARWSHEVVLFSARTDRPDPTQPDWPPSLVLKPRYYHQCSIILAYIFDHPQTRSRGFLEGVWTVSRGYLESVWKVFGRYLEGYGMCLEVVYQLFSTQKLFWTQNFYGPTFFWHWIFQTPNFSGTKFFWPTNF